MTVKLRSLITIILSLCSAAHVVGQCTPIVDAANALGLAAFVQVLQTVGLDQQFSNATDNKDAYTIFVPDNNAFAALAAATGPSVPTAATITPEQKAGLLKVLQTHIVSGNYTREKLTNGMSLTAVSGANLTFAIDTVSGNVTISTPVLNGTGISMANITAPNAKTKLCGYSLIHVINNVLTFPAPAPAAENCTNIVDAMNCSGQEGCPTGTLASATIRSNPQAVTLVSDPTQGYTIFAPSDAAAAKLFQDVAAGKYTATSLQQVLLGHLVAGVYKSANLTDGMKLTTLASTSLTVKVAAGKVTVVGPSGDVVNVIQPDFQGLAPAKTICGDSVAHVIDGVIALPGSQINNTTNTPPPAPGKAVPAAIGSTLLALLAAALALLL